LDSRLAEPSKESKRQSRIKPSSRAWLRNAAGTSTRSLCYWTATLKGNWVTENVAAILVFLDQVCRWVK